MTNSITDKQLLHTLEDFQTSVLLQLQNTSARIDILNHKLDPQLFDSNDIVSEIINLSKAAGRRTSIRLLIKDSDAIVKRHHRLVSAAQRLSSVIQIRKLREQPNNDHMNFMISDRQQVLFQYEDGIYDGYLAPDNRPLALSLLDEFERLWSYHCEEIADIKRLHL